MDKLAFSVPGANGTPIPIQGVSGMPSGSSVIPTAINSIFTLIFVIAGIVALFFIIYGGISWITSAGDKEKIQAARGKIVYAIIGLIIILSSYLIISTVGNLFGVNILNIPAPQAPSCVSENGACTVGQTECCRRSDGAQLICQPVVGAPDISTCR